MNMALMASVALSSIQLQGGVIILPWADDPMDEDAIRLDGIENPISLVGTPPDPMLFVARDQRERAGHVAYALRGLAHLANERDRAGGVVLLDISSDAFEVARGPCGQRDFHCRDSPLAVF